MPANDTIAATLPAAALPAGLPHAGSTAPAGGRAYAAETAAEAQQAPGQHSGTAARPGSTGDGDAPATFLMTKEAGREADSAATEAAGLPLFYRQNFFSHDSTLTAEIMAARYGVAGDPLPYSVKNDNVITSLLLVCFMATVVSVSYSRQFIAMQAKSFFRPPSSRRSFVSETAVEIRLQVFLVALTSLLAAILQFFYSREHIAETYLLRSQYQLIFLFFGIIAGYFACRTAIYTLVNAVFFDMKKNLQWLKALLFITSVEGVMLFPIVLLQVYFGLSPETVTTYSLAVLVLVKILTFHKCFLIFFRRTAFFVQIILYFCALEIVPLVSVWGLMVLTANNFKINL